jgi:hypothetical protein
MFCASDCALNAAVPNAAAPMSIHAVTSVREFIIAHPSRTVFAFIAMPRLPFVRRRPLLAIGNFMPDLVLFGFLILRLHWFRIFLFGRDLRVRFRLLGMRFFNVVHAIKLLGPVRPDVNMEEIMTNGTRGRQRQKAHLVIGLVCRTI